MCGARVDASCPRIVETGSVGTPLSGNARLLVTGQAVRGLGYGFTAVVLGSLLATRGVSPVRAGVLLAVLIGGSAVASLAVGEVGDRFGRRRSYGLFFVGISVGHVVIQLRHPSRKAAHHDVGFKRARGNAAHGREQRRGRKVEFG